MTSNFFDNCGLYKTSFINDDKEEVEKTLYKEYYEKGALHNPALKDINLIEAKDYKWNPAVFVDICMYFGVENINDKLVDIIKFAIITRKLHTTLKYGIVYEKLKDLIIEEGLDAFYKNLNGFEFYNVNHKKYKTRGDMYEYHDYVMRCLYFDEYMLRYKPNMSDDIDMDEVVKDSYLRNDNTSFYKIKRPSRGAL